MTDSAGLLIAGLAAVIPTVLYVLLLWWLDRYEQEPRRLLLVAFWWGALPAVILSALAETTLGRPLAAFDQATAELMSSSLLAPMVEELLKGLAVFLVFLLFRREFDGVLDGVIYGATVGFGFAMTENALYFLGSFGSGGMRQLSVTVFLRSVVFGLNHALFTSAFGASLGYARMAKSGRPRWLVPLVGLGAAMALHGLHNLFASLTRISPAALLLSAVSDWGGVLVILVVIALAWRNEKRWIVTHLKPEVAAGLITQGEYDVISSYRRRVLAGWQARLHAGRAEARRIAKLSQVATDLAFKVEQGDGRTVQKLRQQVIQLRGQPSVTMDQAAGPPQAV